MLRNLNQRFDGARLMASCATGIPGALIARNGPGGPSLMAPSIDPIADAQTEFRYWVHESNIPEASARLNSDGTGAFVGLPDGTYSAGVSLYAFDVPLGQFILTAVVGQTSVGRTGPRVQVQMAPGGGSVLWDHPPAFIGAGARTLVSM